MGPNTKFASERADPRNRSRPRRRSRSRVLIVASKNRVTLREQASTEVAMEGFCGDPWNGLRTPNPNNTVTPVCGSPGH
jgi:hypothetical protein